MWYNEEEEEEKAEEKEEDNDKDDDGDTWLKITPQLHSYEYLDKARLYKNFIMNILHTMIRLTNIMLETKPVQFWKPGSIKI